MGNSAVALRYMEYVLGKWAVLAAAEDGGSGTAVHPETPSCLSNIASFLHKSGALEKACEFHERALAINVRLLGDKHALSIMLHDQLAQAHRALGRADRALSHAQVVHGYFEASAGPKHERTLAALQRVQEVTAELSAMGLDSRASATGGADAATSA